MPIETFAVEGMSCNHCVMHVKKALESVPGVESAEVSLEKASAVVTYDASRFDFEAARKAVEEAGYRLVRQAG
ncbi:MAG: heavy-metal-associated domain-containing protein [Calditrichaeota bacterium]|nr:heavy-metal-associated domain-containing protein [Calditrichota bacterium]